MAGDWSRDEVELVVAEYFAMLSAELAGERVNKAERNRLLRERLDNRSKGSVEFKLANISAVLRDLGDLPFIDGYKPRGNYQRLLEQVVQEWLEGEPDFFERAASSPVIQPTARPATDFSNPLALVESAPEIAERAAREHRPVPVRKVDFVRLDAENRRLGRLGEEWTLEFEARRLHDVAKRPDLARQIVWVSDREGDGAGYDIRSFEADSTPRLIEVKTTGLPKQFPFAVTSNEVGVSEREADRYHLYRLFTFATEPRLYMLKGALSATCRLEPTTFRAKPAGGQSDVAPN